MLEAIEALPAKHQADALDVCSSEEAADAAKLDALFLFSEALAAGKTEDCRFLRAGIRRGWGKGKRQAKQAAKEEAEALRLKRRQEQAAQAKAQELEKNKTVELQRLFWNLDESRQEAIKLEAVRRCRKQFGGDYPDFALPGAITNIMAELQAA